MRTPWLVAAVILAVAGCGGSDDNDGADGSTAGAAEVDQADPPGLSPESTAGGNGAAPTGPAASGADCSQLSSDAIVSFGFATQVLIQIRDAASFEGLRSQALAAYTPEGYASTVAALQTLLDGVNTESFGTPDDELDFFAALNEQIAGLYAIEGEIPQSSFDQYAAAVGDIGEAITKQLPIGAALEAVCPELAASVGG